MIIGEKRLRLLVKLKINVLLNHFSNCNLVQSHHYKLGRIHCLGECPENSFIFGIGGDKRKKNFTVVNSLDFDNVKREFTDLPVNNPIQIQEPAEMDEEMDD